VGAATGFAAQSVDTLFGDQRRHHQSRNRIGPAAEKDRRVGLPPRALRDPKSGIATSAAIATTMPPTPRD